MSDEFRSGFDELSEILKGYELTDEKVLKALEEGAEQFTRDVQRLPKPRSRIRKSGHEHMLDTVTYKRTEKDVEAGWMKYYGLMVERGTVKMRGVPHMKPTFDRNKVKYETTMKNAIFGKE